MNDSGLLPPDLLAELKRAAELSRQHLTRRTAIAVAVGDHGRIVVVASDGTMWMKNAPLSPWSELAPLPQPPEEETPGPGSDRPAGEQS